MTYFRPSKIIFFGFFLRVIVAVWNGFFGPSYGAGADAINTYHEVAVNYAEHLVVSGVKSHLTYSYLLGVFYDIMKDSLFLGSLLSCAVWAFSAIILLKIMRLMSIYPSAQSKAMLIYALLPSSIMFTSVTLKEAYQLFFVNLAVYSTLRLYLDRLGRYWILLLPAVAGMSMLHPALYAFSFFIISSVLISYLFRKGDKFSFIKLGLVTFLIIMVLFLGYRYKHVFNVFTVKPITAEEAQTAVTGQNRVVAALNKLVDRIKDYQENGLKWQKLGRAFYKTNVSISGIPGLLFFIPVSLFQYLFEPMPWRISAVVDLEAIFENILRILLIWMALSGFRKIHAKRRTCALFIFSSYLLLEAIWSLGTVNWGTAIRHHIPAMGLLLVAAFASHSCIAIAPQHNVDLGFKNSVMEIRHMIRYFSDNKGRIILFLAALTIILLWLNNNANYSAKEEKINAVNITRRLNDSAKALKRERAEKLDLNRQLNDYAEALKQGRAKTADLNRQLNDYAEALKQERAEAAGLNRQLNDYVEALKQERARNLELNRELNDAVKVLKRVESCAANKGTGVVAPEANKNFTKRQRVDR